MKTQQELVEYVRQRPGITPIRICSNLKGVTRAQANAAIKVACGMPVNSAPVRPSRRTHNIAEFRRAHDIPEKIRTKLADMAPGTYVNEEEMRHHCEVAVQNWRRNAELPEFEPHKFKYDGITYWGPTATIKEMKVITGKA